MSAQGTALGAAEDVLVVPPEGSDCRWVCLHTRPKREKKLYDACQDLGVNAYLPLRVSVKTYAKSRAMSRVPYFSGYVFVCGSPFNLSDLFCSGHVANVLEPDNQEKLVRDLRQVEQALQVSQGLETYPYIKRGRRVRIKRGPFRGVEGIVSKRRSKFRVVLNVDFIQKALAVEVDADAVEPV